MKIWLNPEIELLRKEEILVNNMMEVMRAFGYTREELLDEPTAVFFILCQFLKNKNDEEERAMSKVKKPRRR